MIFKHRVLAVNVKNAVFPMQKMMMRDVVTRKLAGRRKVHCQITMRWLTFQAKANPPTFIVVCVVNSSIIQIISSFSLVALAAAVRLQHRGSTSCGISNSAT